MPTLSPRTSSKCVAFPFLWYDCRQSGFPLESVNLGPIVRRLDHLGRNTAGQVMLLDISSCPP